MKQSVKNHLLQWGDRLVEKYTKLSHNRLTKYTIGAILMSGAALVFGLPAIRLEHDAHYSYWKALIDYNETNPWGCVVLIVSICAATIVYVTNRICDRSDSGDRSKKNTKNNNVGIKGDGNMVVQDSNNTFISK